MNSLRLQSGLTRIDAAPSNQNATTLTPFTASLYDISEAPSSWSITTVAGDDWLLTGGSLYLFEGGPRNPTRNFFKGPFRLCDRIPGNTAVPPVGVTPVNGSMTVVAGQRVFLRAIAQAPDGRLSNELIINALAVA
jgi:hypothetical protein